MKKIILLLTMAAFAAGGYAQQKIEWVPNQVVLKFKDSKMPSSVNARKIQNAKTIGFLNQEKDLAAYRLTGNKREVSTYVLTYESKKDVYELIDEFMETGLFEYVEPNLIGYTGGERMIPSDAAFGVQWNLVNDGSMSIATAKPDADVDADLAWDYEQGDPSIIVAIIDTGCKLDHPELSGRNWINTAETLDGTDSDGNGFIDDVDGWDFQNDDNDPSDDHGHGTAVAGVVGANGDNGVGFAGVDWNCQLMHLKAMDSDGSGSFVNWVDAMYYAVDNGASVINMSLGSFGGTTTLLNAVNYAHGQDVAVVCSAGNFDTDIMYPAEYANSIAVGATDPEDNRSVPFPGSPGSGSCYGAKLNLVAPGSYIYALQHDADNVFNQHTSGTSFSCPMVAGAIALLLAQDPSRDPDELENILQVTAEDLVGDTLEDTPGFDIYYGWGRLNIFLALNFESLGFTEEEPAGVKIYPNPAQELLHVNLKGLHAGEIRVLNTMGQVVIDESFNSSFFRVNTAKLESGAYIVQIYDTNQSLVSTEKLIRE